MLYVLYYCAEARKIMQLWNCNTVEVGLNKVTSTLLFINVLLIKCYINVYLIMMPFKYVFMYIYVIILFTDITYSTYITMNTSWKPLNIEI